jgi:hypothetical protein
LAACRWSAELRADAHASVCVAAIGSTTCGDPIGVMPHAENTMRELTFDAKGRFWYGSPANDRVGYFYLAGK